MSLFEQTTPLRWHRWPESNPVSAGIGFGPFLLAMDPQRYGPFLREALYLEVTEDDKFCWPSGQLVVVSQDVVHVDAEP